MSKLSLREIAQSQLDSTPVIDGQLIVCLDTGNAYRDTATAHVKIGSDLEVVSDLPLAPLAEKLYYLKPDKLYVFLGGNWTLLNDKTIDLDESIAKLPAGTSTDLNDDVEIITQDTDFTQPHYYRRKLVVLWEYIKAKAQDFFAAKDHKHKKADITDFPTSMPASDVHPWAKEATKPSYTKAEVGLGNVDNTADADKSVKYATNAGSADNALKLGGLSPSTDGTSKTWGTVPTVATTGVTELGKYIDLHADNSGDVDYDIRLTANKGNLEVSGGPIIGSLLGNATSADSVPWSGITDKPTTFPAAEHNHDDRYYTESEVDGKLANKLHEETYSGDLNDLKTTGLYHGINCANAPENCHSTVFVDFSVGTPYQLFSPDYRNAAYKRIYSGGAWTGWTELSFTDTKDWAAITGKPSTFPPEDHTHDDRYYTEAEVDGKLSGKVGFGTVSSALVAQPGNNPYIGNVEGEDIGVGEGSYYSVINLGSYSGGNFRSQIAVPYQDSIADSNMYIRTAAGASWRPWRKIIHSGNIGDQTVAKANVADSANVLSGLSSRSGQNWGVQTGTFVHGECDSTGGDFAFRRDCPNAGQLSMVIDGRFYQNEGNYRVLDESDIAGIRTRSDTDVGVPLARAGDSNTVPWAGACTDPDFSQCRSMIGTEVDGGGTWWNILSIRHRNGAGDGPSYGLLLFSQLTNTGDTLWYRKQNGDGWTDNRNILDSTNYSSYALPISGGTLSGNIHFADIGNVGTSSGITWGGSTDGAGIYYQTTGADQGNLVLNLTDDYNCFLRIAQNGNFKSYFSPNDGNFHGNVNGTADVANVANFAKETYISQYKTVNLTDLDQNTWYPVTGDSIPYNGLRRFKCNVQLNSGSKPNWSTHSSGFTAVVDLLCESSGWGTTNMLGMVLTNDQYWINDYNNPPVGFQQMSYGSVPVWWLRGGGSYRLATDYDITWTIRKSTYTNNGQSVSPTTTYPGVYVNRSTITANLDGNASTATCVKDIGNSSNTTFAYSKDGMNYGDYTWLAGWNGYELRAVNKNQFAQAHSHPYLPLGGGTMSGALNFANNTWNLVGDDAYMGDHNIGGSFCIMGANDTTRLALVNKDNQGDYALIEYGGGNLNFNKKLGANITGHADGDLALSGGTLTGDIAFSNCGTGTRQILFTCADNDYGRIAVGGTASNAGYMEIATADDGNEPIYVRQYSGIYASIVRSATLLDGSGNTTFPGYVTGARFYTGDWFRATGNSGFYFENHGGGWYMTDDTWIRAYNNKNIYTPGVIQCDGGFNGSLNGNANTATLIRHQGNVTAISGTDKRTAGLQLYGAYANGYPMSYGNVICASNGAFGSEIALDCVGGGGKQGPGRMYYRNRSDWGTSEWSDWATVAYLTDKVAGANHADSADSATALNMNSAGSGNSIYGSGNDAVNGPGGGLNNVVISSWYGVSFTSSCGSTYGGKNQTAVGIDCREGIVKAARFDGNVNGNVNGNCYGYADYLYNEGVGNMRFHWSGQGGQPTWLWGSNDGSNAYVWNPSNFSVNYANSAGNGVTASGSNYVRFGNGTQICWGYKNENGGGTTSFAVAFDNTSYALALTATTKSNNAPFITGCSTTSFSYERNGTAWDNIQWIAVGTWK